MLSITGSEIDICFISQYSRRSLPVFWRCLINLIQWRPTNTLQLRHNGRDDVSNHQPQHCLLNRLFRRRSKKASKLHVTGHGAGNSPVTGEFPAKMASNAEKSFHLMTSSWHGQFPPKYWRYDSPMWARCTMSLRIKNLVYVPRTALLYCIQYRATLDLVRARCDCSFMCEVASFHI